MHLTNQDLLAFKATAQQPSDGTIVAGLINAELLFALRDTADSESKDKVIWPVLEQIFTGFDWSQGFEHNIVIIYDETFTPEIAQSLHYWLRTKCTRIENIHVICLDNPAAQWWQRWCDVMHERSYRVVDVLHTVNADRYFSGQTPPLRDAQGIHRHFSYWGGSYPSRSKNYLLMEISQYRPWAYVDNMGPLLPRQEILDYVENITYYQSQVTVDRIAQCYDELVRDHQFLSNVQGTKKHDEPFDGRGLQWHIDQQCMACVVRETDDTLPYANITEKTLRAFWHGSMVIPISYQAVCDLERCGFQFAHDLFDYSYQHEPDFFRRVQALKRSLDRFIQQCPADRLPQLWHQHRRIWQHNAQTVVRLLAPDHIACEISKNM